MRLWRKIVSVFAGTMIAAGGIVGALAVFEVTSPSMMGGDPPETTSRWLFEPTAAEAAVSADIDAVRTWLNQTATSGGTHNSTTAFDAALAAGAIAGVASGGGAGTTNATRAEVFVPTADLAAAEGVQAVVDSGAVLLESDSYAGSSPPQAPAEMTEFAGSAFALVLTTASLRAYSLDTDADSLVASAPDLVDVPLSNASATITGATTESVALLAAVDHAAPEHANWTEAAKAEIVERAQAGALEQDTVTLALSSQALRSQDPASAAAINSELRFRQSPDGSFGGDIRATSEAVRALAFGTALDRQAAARGLDWLDSQSTLTTQEATYRLRAHATGGALESPPPPSAAPADSAMGFSALPTGGKGILAFLFLAGGIGLSLTLVTDDALKGARRRLYDTIRAEPGLHVNELRRRLRMSPSSIEYHLSVLTGAGLVISEDDGRYKRFYANGAGLGLNPGSPNSRNALGALRRPHAAELVQHMLERGDATAREVSRALNLHESAASRRLDHLERAGLLSSERVGRERRYKVRDRQAAIKALTLVEAQVAPAVMQAGEPPAAERGPSEGVPASAASP